MGKQKDLGEKILEAIPEVFADIFNVLICDGKEVMDEKDLTEADARSQYKAADKYHELERDVSMYWNNAGIRIACCGFENQTDTDKYMPIRVLGYDAGAYRQQLIQQKGKKNKKKNKKKSKNKPIYPVMTLVLHFGMEKWSGPTSLVESVDVMPAVLKDKINDYKINVFDIAFLPRETIDKFKSDFWFVADYFWQKKNAPEYNMPKKQIRYAHALLQAMAAFTRDKRFEEAYNKGAKQGGGNTMSEVFLDQLEEKGLAKGLAKGQEFGIKAMIYDNLEEKVPEEKIKDKLVRFFGLSEEDAERYIEKYALQPA